MRIEDDAKLDFKDVLIKPKRSTLSSRSEVNIDREFTFYHSKKTFRGVPIIAANMDVVGTIAMAKEFAAYNMMVALHKHYPVDELVKAWPVIKNNVFYSMGIVDRDYDKLKSFESALEAPEYICLDVANGYSEKFVDFVKRMRDEYPASTIMAGNVVTAEMTEALILAGADIVKIGIGSGATCTTRVKTGCGYPQLSAVIECADAAHGLKGHICSDGGCTVPGDIVKAFGGGADFVMAGGIFAGHDECEGELIYEQKMEGSMYGSYMVDDEEKPIAMKFYGMSSDTAMEKHSGGVAEYRASEGKTVEVPYKGPVKNTIQDILGGLRSAMTYVGAARLKEFSKRTTFVRVSQQENLVFGKE